MLDLGAGASYAGVTTAKKPKPKSTATKSSRRINRGSSGGGSSYRSSGSSGGGSSRGGSSGGGSSYSPPKLPKPPSIGSYLGGDSAYQQAVRGGKRGLTDFLSEMGRRRGEATTQFNQTRGSMERDRTMQLEDLRNEFASRGLIQSGLYGEEQGKFQQKFTEQQTALQQQQAALIADLLSQTKNFRRENDLTLEQARQEALLRRTQKFKL